MAEIVVIAAAADQEAALELAGAISRAGVEAAVQPPTAPIAPSSFILICLTNHAPTDAALVKFVWLETPMKEDPTGRYMFAFFDPAAAANANFAPFLKRHFATAGDAADAFAAHVNTHRGLLAAQVKAAEEARERYQKEIASRPPPAERFGAGAGDIDRPMGVGAAAPRPEGIGAAADPPRRLPSSTGSAGYSDATRDRLARIDAEEDARRAATREAHAQAAPAAVPSMPMPMPTPPKPAKLDKVDARAFAPKKLRRATTELIRVAVFRPQDKSRAMRAAKQADASTQTAGASQPLGKIARGATVTVALDARGAHTDAASINQEWTGAPLDFNFPVEVTSDDAVGQALFTIRILVDDAQVGAITFVRPLAKAKKSGAASKLDSQEKLRRVSRAFLSYASADRASVGLIASAYQRAGIPCFFDRSSLSSGEEWSPRLQKEIERADLFHLCWSKQAAHSQWVVKEATHAMNARRQRKRPEITIQMLDGPPWAPHPQDLDALNFDDYARAAIVGYARGDRAG